MFCNVISAQDSIINGIRSNNIIIQFKLPSYTISDTVLPSEYGVSQTFKYIHMADESYGIIDSIGLPVLPQKTFTLSLPANVETVSASVTNTSYSTIDLTSHILPCQEDISKDSIVFNYTIDNTYYSSGGGAFNTLYEMDDIFDVHGVKGVSLSVMPFIYNPSKKQLRILQQATITLSYTCDSVGDSTYSISQVWDDYLSRFFDNYTPTLRSNSTTGRYLIITHPLFASTIQQFADYKRNIGFEVNVVSTEYTGVTVNMVKNIIVSHYMVPSYRPDFVLLVGDHQHIPAADGDATMNNKNNPITDLPYSLLVGNDKYADVFLGRWSVTDTSQLKIIVNKTISMEMKLPKYEKKAKFLAGDESSNYMRKSFERAHDVVIEDYFNSNGYSCQKLYQVNGSTALNALNDNPMLYLYSGHGDTNLWAGITFNMTQYIISNSNHDTYPLSFAYACRTGNFAVSTCIGEIWLRHRSGGVCYIGCSVNSKTNTDEVLEKKMLGAIYFNNNHIGSIFAMSIKEFKNSFVWWAGARTKERYMKAYNLLGDPTFNVRGIGYKKNLNLINHNIYDGDTVYYYANNTLQSTGSIVVHNGGSANINARTEITLQPGFEVKHGGTCHLYLHNFNRNENGRQFLSPQTKTVKEGKDLNIYPIDENTLFECYPNPTSGLLNIRYRVDQKKWVSISLYNLHGILQQELYNGIKEEGVYYERIDISGLPTGSYFIRFMSGDNQSVRKIIKH